MSNEIIALLVTNVLSPFLVWWFGRKKTEAEARKVDVEADQGELDNVERAIAIWRNMATELSDTVSKLHTDVLTLTNNNANLTKELHDVKASNAKLLEEVHLLRSEIEKLSAE